MQNHFPPCSVELRSLSTFKHEMVLIEMKINKDGYQKDDTLVAALEYMKRRVEEIQSRL